MSALSIVIRYRIYFLLGNVITLKGLNLRNCPITFPPPDILHQGLQSILQFLRSVMAQRPVSVTKSPPGKSKPAQHSQSARASRASALCYFVKDRTTGPKNSSMPWYHFTCVTCVPLETARASRLTSPSPSFSFQHCSIFSRMKKIDNLPLSSVWR